MIDIESEEKLKKLIRTIGFELKTNEPSSVDINSILISFKYNEYDFLIFKKRNLFLMEIDTIILRKFYINNEGNYTYKNILQKKSVIDVFNFLNDYFKYDLRKWKIEKLLKK